MKGKINECGELLIQRGSHFNPQMCPFMSGSPVTVGGSIIRCGDHCPQFGEPSLNAFDATHLTICIGRTLVFREGFEDLRKKD